MKRKKEKNCADNPQKTERVIYPRSSIAEYLQNLRFRPRLFGVDQQDVWIKIEELNRMYAAALREERVRFDAVLGDADRARGQKEEEGMRHADCG